MADKRVKRAPVEHDYTALNWDFLKRMARIPIYANEKYGSWHQYTQARLELGEKSPVNHAIEHLRSYLAGEAYDHFDGGVGWHLVAAAYNCSMEFYYLSRWGHVRHPLQVDDERRKSTKVRP